MIDDRTRFNLLRRSQHFCAVPWNHMVIHTNGDVRTCTATRMALGNINHDSIHDILQSELVRDIRRTLRADQPHANCAMCQRMSHGDVADGYHYLRDMYNHRFSDSPVDYDDDTAFTLTGVDLHWSNTCNLKCITCWAPQSSAIAAEQGITISAPTPDSIAKITDFIVEHQLGLREIYLSGGEPTLIKHNLALLDRIEPRDDLLIRVNSNLAWKIDNRVLTRIMQFPRVLFTVSADGLDQRFEYIRSGASWQQFCDNLAWLSQQPCDLRVNSVFSVSTAAVLLDMHTFFRDQFGIYDFTINQCAMEQYALMARNLPEQLKSQLNQQLHMALQDATLGANLQGQLRNCQSELVQPSNGHSYADYFDAIDRRRGTNWRQVFPELT